jgi:hypothetical protein
VDTKRCWLAAFYRSIRRLSFVIAYFTLFAEPLYRVDLFVLVILLLIASILLCMPLQLSCRRRLKESLKFVSDTRMHVIGQVIAFMVDKK